MSDKKSTFLERAGAIGNTVSLLLKDGLALSVPPRTFAAQKNSSIQTRVAFKTLTQWVDVKEDALADTKKLDTLLNAFTQMKQTLNHTQSLRQAMGMANLVSTERFYPGMEGNLKEKLESWLKHNVEDVNGRTIARPETAGVESKKSCWLEESCSVLIQFPIEKNKTWHITPMVEYIVSNWMEFGGSEELKKLPFWKFSKKAYDKAFGESFKVQYKSREGDLCTTTIYPVYQDSDAESVKRQVDLWLKKAMKNNVPTIFFQAKSVTANTRVDQEQTQRIKEALIATCERLRFRAKLNWSEFNFGIPGDKSSKNQFREVHLINQEDAGFAMNHDVNIKPVTFDFKANWHFQFHKRDSLPTLYQFDLVKGEWIKCQKAEASLGTIHVVQPELMKAEYSEGSVKKIAWNDAYLTECVFKDSSFEEKVNAYIFMDTFSEFASF